MNPYPNFSRLSRPLIVGSIGEGFSLTDAREAMRSGADWIELRVDALRPEDRARIEKIVAGIKKNAPLPLIATVRMGEEQWKSSGSIELAGSERKELFERLALCADWIDIELASSQFNAEIIKIAHKNKKKVILSYHDFSGMPGPAKLQAQLKKFKSLSGDILKIAVRPNSVAGTAEFLSSGLKLKTVPHTLIAMGKWGRLSRLAGFAFGSCLAYGYVRRPTAPGQFSVRELADQFKKLYPER